MMSVISTTELPVQNLSAARAMAQTWQGRVWGRGRHVPTPTNAWARVWDASRVLATRSSAMWIPQHLVSNTWDTLLHVL